MISCLLTTESPAAPAPASNAVRAANTWDASWGVNDELQNIQAILPSSSSEILSER
jgi:hypothetical protein